MVDILSFARSFLVWPACLGIIIAAAALQLWLSSRKKPWPGLVPLIVLSVVCLSLTAWMFYTESQYSTQTLQCDLPEGRTAESVVGFDGKGKIMWASDIAIKDSSGQQLDSVGWGEFRLKDVGEKLKGTYKLDENTPPAPEPGEPVFKLNGTYYSNSYFFWVLVDLGVPLLGIYLFKRVQLRRKLRERMFEKAQLQELR